MVTKVGPYRRTLAEVSLMYQLHPDLRDLYVEGPSDQRFYARVLEESGTVDVKVRDIGAIDIPSQTLDAYMLAHGNRGRVIALALQLDAAFPCTLSFVRCIIDSDFDSMLNFANNARHLLRTDYSSIELYAFNSATVNDALIYLGYNLSTQDVHKLIDSMRLVLKELFVLRTANQNLGWGMAFVQFTRCCAITDDGIRMDNELVVDRYLHKNVRFTQRQEFQDNCSVWRSRGTNDDREMIRGTDFVELIGWYLRKRFNWNGYRQGKRSAMPALMHALVTERVMKEALFAELVRIFG